MNKTLFECDHMRPVAYVNGELRHINANGEVIMTGPPCGSTAYRLDVSPSNTECTQHYLSRVVSPA